MAQTSTKLRWNTTKIPEPLQRASHERKQTFEKQKRPFLNFSKLKLKRLTSAQFRTPLTDEKERNRRRSGDWLRLKESSGPAPVKRAIHTSTKMLVLLPPTYLGGRKTRISGMS